MRPIDADALIDTLGVSDEDINFREMLDEAPSIDICFCEECKWENTQKCPPHRMGLIHDESDYCSYGIRRTDDE